MKTRSAMGLKIIGAGGAGWRALCYAAAGLYHRFVIKIGALLDMVAITDEGIRINNDMLCCSWPQILDQRACNNILVHVHCFLYLIACFDLSHFLFHVSEVYCDARHVRPL